MIRRKGFDTGRYLSAQVHRIMERVEQYDKLYLEFGGKLRYDHHASRVLPGFELDTKVQMLRKLGFQAEIVHCISAKDIERRKVRRDFGLTYEDQIIKDIGDLRELGLDVTAVVITRYEGEHTADKFRQRLTNRGIKVYVHPEIEGYLTDVDRVVSDEGYGQPEHVDTSHRIIVVTAPGPGSGKMSFCMSQFYQDRKMGVMSGFAKFETFPIWNLPVGHPVNVAYEAATADVGDFNCLDPWHREAYGVEATNYNRDVENFAIMRRIIEKMTGPGDPMAEIRSPTDMGVNMAGEGIVDDEACREASREEIVRRFYQYQREFVEGLTTYDTLERMEAIMASVGVAPRDREVALAANRALEVCLSQRIDIKLASVSEGKDPCDFLLANGKGKFEQLVADAVDVFQFKWNRLLESFSSDDTLVGRKLAVEEYLQTIAASLWAGYMPPLDKGLVLNRLSKIVGLDSKQINAELCKRIGRLAKAEKKEQEKQKVQNMDFGQGLYATAQREVLEVLLNEPKLFEVVQQKIIADDFDVPILKQIAAILFEALSTDNNTLLKTIVARAESVGLGAAVVELVQAGEQKGNFESRLVGAVEVLQRYQAQKKKHQLKTTRDQTEYLRCVSANAAKPNRHNLGIVE